MTTIDTITSVTAGDPQTLATLVQDAAAAKTPIVDYGVAHQGLGHRPPAAHLALTQTVTGSGIIDHYDRDMTVRVAAGAKLGDVQHALAASNQFIPFDADDDLSIGEIITTNTWGPLRMALGGPRDLLLGLHYIDGKARNIQAGGRTVKNVAGIDVTRLMVGSLGELGIIHQATLRTYAIPEHVLVVHLTLDDPAKLGSYLTHWLLSDAVPAWLTLEKQVGQWRVVAGYLGKASACNAQLTALEKFIASIPTGLSIQGSENLSFKEAMTRHQHSRSWQRAATAVVKLITPPAATGEALAELEKAHPGLHLSAMPAHGCIMLGGDLSADHAIALDKTLATILSRHDAIRSWIARPQGSENAIAPFAPALPEMPVLINLKNTMDPHHLLNPGRLIVQ